MTIDVERRLRDGILAYKPLRMEGVDDLSVTPILNWGGFVNRSFRVSGGGVAFHVKLSDDAETLEAFRRWCRLNPRLAQRYGAPVVRGWVDLPGSALGGPVCKWIAGATPASLDPPLLAAATDRVAALHRDGELARELVDMGVAAGSCERAYRSTFHRRFVEDLRSIEVAPPAFVSAQRVDWMAAEAEALRGVVRRSPAFAEPAAAPVHGDLWLNNLLVTEAGALHLLDWDDLAVGDPMMDWAMLLGPSLADLHPADRRSLPSLPFSGREIERFGLYVRASLLDWVIDPLADWLEAKGAAQQDAVRARKRRVHEEALVIYRDLYK